MNKDAESFYQFLLDMLDVPPGYECNIEFDEEKGEIYAIKTPKREKGDGETEATLRSV